MKEKQRMPQFGDYVWLEVKEGNSKNSESKRFKVLDYQEKENATAFTTDALWQGLGQETLISLRGVLTIWDGKKIFDVFFDDECRIEYAGDKGIFEAKEDEMRNIVKHLPAKVMIDDLIQTLTETQLEVVRCTDVNGKFKQSYFDFTYLIAKLKLFARIMSDKREDVYPDESNRKDYIYNELPEIKDAIERYSKKADNEYSWQMLAKLQSQLKDLKNPDFSFGNDIKGHFTGDYSNNKITVMRKIGEHTWSVFANIKIDKHLIHVIACTGPIRYGFIADPNVKWNNDNIQSEYVIEYDNWKEQMPVDKVMKAIENIQGLVIDYEIWEKEHR